MSFSTQVEGAMKRIIAASEKQPKMEFPGVKIIVPQGVRHRLVSALESLGKEIVQQGYQDGSTSWAVAIRVDRRFNSSNLSKLQDELRKSMSYDQYMVLEWLDLVEPDEYY
jgi:hypothetical protein